MPFMLVDEYPLGTAGNACFTCHVQKQTPETRLIDLGVSTDGIVEIDGSREIREGFAVICENCVKELTEMLGWTTDDAARKIAYRDGLIADLQRELADLRALKEQVTKMTASVR